MEWASRRVVRSRSGRREGPRAKGAAGGTESVSNTRFLVAAEALMLTLTASSTHARTPTQRILAAKNKGPHIKALPGQKKSINLPPPPRTPEEQAKRDEERAKQGAAKGLKHSGSFRYVRRHASFGRFRGGVAGRIAASS
jgi:hypothetical protein